MTYTKLVIRNHRRTPGYLTVHYHGWTDEHGFGRCTTEGLLCDVWKLEGGYVVMDRMGRRPIRIEPTADSLSEWLGSFGAPMETVVVG